MIYFESLEICGRKVDVVYAVPVHHEVADSTFQEFLDAVKREDAINSETGKWLLGLDFGWKPDFKSGQRRLQENPIRYVQFGSMRRALVVDLIRLSYRMPQKIYQFLRDAEQRSEFGLVGCHMQVSDDRKLESFHGFRLSGAPGVWDVGVIALQRNWGHTSLFSLSQRLFREPLDKTKKQKSFVAYRAFRAAQDAVVARWVWEHLTAEEPDSMAPDPFDRHPSSEASSVVATTFAEETPLEAVSELSPAAKRETTQVLPIVEESVDEDDATGKSQQTSMETVADSTVHFSTEEVNPPSRAVSKEKGWSIVQRGRNAKLKLLAKFTNVKSALKRVKQSLSGR
jgi:hypothetical protein